MAAPKKSPRARRRPEPVEREGTTRGAEKSPPSKLAPKKSQRPRSREEGKASQSQRLKNDRKRREEGMASGGKVRGMGAAKRGGKFTRSA